MAHYHSLGKIPHKRHTQFRKPDGTLYSEQLFSTEGFSNNYSLLYHCHPPTQIIKTDEPINIMPAVAEEKMLKHRSLEGFNIKPEKDFLQSRKPILVNNDCHISLAAPQESIANYFVFSSASTPATTERENDRRASACQGPGTSRGSPTHRA